MCEKRHDTVIVLDNEYFIGESPTLAGLHCKTHVYVGLCMCAHVPKILITKELALQSQSSDLTMPLVNTQVVLIMYHVRMTPALLYLMYVCKLK